MSSDFYSAMSIGLLVWLFSYGMNRVWLVFKNIAS